ncbi:ABC transporter permease [Streptosporangium sp. CA-115845]|uniref:ABC transporter permease n=1 Tax=Streptosporangium sp. CA-115845 TaxID=3240071 RepID=UPI003D93F907
MSAPSAAAPRGLLRRRPGRGSPLSLAVGVGMCAVLVLLALTHRMLEPYDPGASELARRLLAPGGDHLLGTDQLGRDVLSRVLAGTSWSLGIGTVATALGAVTGTLIGVGAGWSQGWVRVVLTRAVDIGISFPYLVTAITVIAVIGHGFWPLALTLGLVSWPTFARVVYAETLGLAKREYVTAARLIGVGRLASVFSHVLPALRPTLQVMAAFMFADMLIAESSLSFLGLGAPLGVPTWGNMLAESKSYLATSPWLMLAPAAATVASVLAANMLGDGLTARDRLKNTRAG